MSDLKIEILGNSYETNYPTVGQCIDIKRLEMSLSGNRLGALVTSPLLEDSEVALDIKAVAVLSILFPQAKADLKTNSFLDLRYDDWTVVMKVFTEKVFPWYMGWKDSLRKPDINKVLKDDTDTRTED